MKHSSTLAARVHARTGEDPARCYQCGKCSAGCPMAAEMPLGPQRIMRLVQLGRWERLRGDPSIWLCLTCETCSSRCPQEVDPAGVVDALRELAHAEGYGGPRRLKAFHDAFLAEIAARGRVWEMGLVSRFKLASGALMDDVTAAPSMLARGKLPLTPRRIKGRDEVRRIVAACLAKEEEQ